MKCRKNLRVLIEEYNSADDIDKPNTELMKLKQAILDLKNPALFPSQLISRADVVDAIDMDIMSGDLFAGSTLLSRYDDYVWTHHQVMMLGPNGNTGPNYAHRGPAFGPWHRALLQFYEQDLQTAAGDPDLTLPYWDWTKDQDSGDPGYPFFDEFLGGNGSGIHDKVTTGDFAVDNGKWTFSLDEEDYNQDSGADPVVGYLRRDFGTDGPGLPPADDVKDALAITTYDSSGWDTGVASANSFRNTLEGWVGPADIHNAVHRWVNGSMQPGTSPNDPIFFFHHCNVDRLWAVWQQKNPTSAGYLPDNTTASASGLTRLDDNMSSFGRTAEDRYFGVDLTPNDVLNSKAIMWYDSDLPEITNETGATLAFTDIPEGLTMYKAVKFKAIGCQNVYFRITSAPGGNFGLTSMGTDFEADPSDEDFVYGYVWVQLTAPAGAVANSSVDIEAYIIDDEGYYAASDGGEYILGTYHVELTATTVPRENNSVALVLDRSGSMSEAAGGTSTKVDLLKNAVSVFETLMLSDDEIALVTFDDLVDTPLAMQAAGGAPVAAVLAGTDLDPRGMTWIGGGIAEGAVQLGAATHTNKSMLVLTDGNENVHPYVAELPAGTITNRTYAIGFGLPGNVSDTVLNQITSNTNGDLIITGDISTTEQQFNLTKYFVQVLAGVTNMDIILDPQGSLFFGSKHVIPFDVAAADVYVDMIALCPLPKILDFFVETPSGKVIKPATAGLEPNVKYIQGKQVLCYRIALPALTKDVPGSHAGKWKAILMLKDKETVSKLIRDDKHQTVAGISNTGSVPYSFIAHAYSNVRLDAHVQAASLMPGSQVTIMATLKEYDVSFMGKVAVWVDVTTPDLSMSTIKLDKISNGTYSGFYDTILAGVYKYRVRAEGYTSGGDEFTREKTLTNGMYYGNYDTIPDDHHHEGSGGDCLCGSLSCLLSEKVLTKEAEKRLSDMGINIRGLRECVDSHCKSKSYESIKKNQKKPTVISASAIKTAAPAKLIKKTKAVLRQKPKKVLSVRKSQPRIVHRFSPDSDPYQKPVRDEKSVQRQKKK